MKSLSLVVGLIAVGVLACSDDSSSGGGGSGGGTNTGAGNVGGSNNGGSATGGSGTGGSATGGSGTGGSATGGSGTGGGSGVSVAACAAECEEAKTGQCTGIIGDCTQCCDAGLSITMCSAEYDTYYQCVSSGATACTNSCTTEEQAVQDCLINYCQTHLAEPACQTLLGCVQLG